MVRSLANVDLNLLLPLQALLRERNVTRAARRLGVSQPTMSSSLKRLRIVLDDALLIRSDGEYHLTPRARHLVDPLEDVLRLLGDEILGLPGFDPVLSERTFRIAASSSTAYVALREVIAQSTRAHPGISFVIHSEGRSADDQLQELELDLVLLPDVLPTVHPRDRLYDETWVLVAWKGNPVAAGPVSVDQLYASPHAVYEDGGLRTHGELALAAHGRTIRSAVVGSDFMSIFHLVVGTELLALVQGRVAETLAEANGLVIVDCPVPLPSFGIDMVWNPLTASDPARAWLEQELRRSFAN